MSEVSNVFYLTGAMRGAPIRAAHEKFRDIGQLLGPRGFCRPQCQIWACDNDCFSTSAIGPRPDPNYWKQHGERRWLRMLDRVAALVEEEGATPLFCVVPDIPGHWKQTLERWHQYAGEVTDRGLPTALALQDGSQADDWKVAFSLSPDYFFVGGTTYWKWHFAPRICRDALRHKIHIHIGRVNGEKPIRRARKMGAASADGTGLCRHFHAELPGVLRGLYEESPQLEMML